MYAGKQLTGKGVKMDYKPPFRNEFCAKCTRAIVFNEDSPDNATQPMECYCMYHKKNPRKIDEPYVAVCGLYKERGKKE